jgi:type IV fimbrial biogenesis protein FimT
MIASDPDEVGEMTRTSHGFTLLEAIVALVVVVILATVTVPMVGNARAAVQAGNARAAMTTTLIASMRQATVGGIEVVICPTADAGLCRNSTDWSMGWTAFVDRDGDRLRGPDEAVVHQEASLDDVIRLQSTPGRTRLVFQPGGSNAGSNVTFTLCDRRGPGKAIALILANGGRVRARSASSERAERCIDALSP